MGPLLAALALALTLALALALALILAPRGPWAAAASAVRPASLAGAPHASAPPIAGVPKVGPYVPWIRPT